jgi:hypothetical protein
MRAKAISVGFISGSLVQPGQEFEVPDGAKGSWFVPVNEFKAAPKPKQKVQPQTLSEMAKGPVNDGAGLA